MSANQNAIQGTIVAIVTVVCALLDGTFNALVCVTVHNHSSFFGNGVSINEKIEKSRGKCEKVQKILI